MEELTRRRVHRDPHVNPGAEPRLLDSGDDELQRLAIGVDVGREATFVTNPHRKTLVEQDHLQRAIDLAAPTDCLTKVCGAVRSDHVLLNVRALAVSVHTAVENVHQRHRQPRRSGATKVQVKRTATSLGGGTGTGHRNTEDGVGAESALVGGPVQSDHARVKLGLPAGIHADQVGSDGLLDPSHGIEDPFAAVSMRVAVAQLHGLATAG